jgi:hypothetical protein
MVGELVLGGSGGGGGFTLTVNDALFELSVASVAVHSTMVSPTGNSDPEVGSQEIVIFPPSLSCVTVVPSSSSWLYHLHYH